MPGSADSQPRAAEASAYMAALAAWSNPVPLTPSSDGLSTAMIQIKIRSSEQLHRVHRPTMDPTPCLRLPLEILRNVTAYLNLHDQVRLSMTNRHFWFAIQPPTHNDFLAAETCDWAISKQFYTCGGCAQFRRLRDFADDMRKGTRARNGLDARTRLCLRCGVEEGWYPEGAKIAIYGKPAVLVRSCMKLTDHVNCIASFGSLGFFWTSLQRDTAPFYVDTHHFEHDDDWSSVRRSHVEIKYAQEEEHGLWFDL